METLLWGRRQAKNDQRPSLNSGPTLFQLQPHEPSVPATNPLSPIALCTGHRCAAIQRPLEDLHLKAGTVSSDGSGLSGRQCVLWTHEPVVDVASYLCLAMLVRALCKQVQHSKYLHFTSLANFEALYYICCTCLHRTLYEYYHATTVWDSTGK